MAIGASAGSLGALEKPFASIPPDTGATFAVNQYLSPDHNNIMASLLSRHTKMPNVAVEDEMGLETILLTLPGVILRVLNLTSEGFSTRQRPISGGAGITITDYKQGTLNRRIERRMVVRQGSDTDGCSDMLVTDKAEVLALRREFLTPVTQLFSRY